VLFVLVDTLRADHVRPFGALTDADAIEKLAREGVRFDDAITVVPKTPAAVASLLTGRYPTGHGVRSLYEPLADSQRTLAEAFSEAGYETAAMVDNAWLSARRGFGQGFRRYDDYFAIDAPYGPLRYASWVVLADRLTLRRIRTFDGQTSARVLTDRALDWARRHAAERFFLYVHYFEPHWPYYPPADLARRYGAPPDGRVEVNEVQHTSVTRGEMIFQNPWPDPVNEAARRLYRGEVHDTIDEIGRLFAGLDGLGLGDDTIVVFTADHGHALGDHGYYFHHGEFLYESSLRIPLVLRWPGRLPAGRVVREQVRSVDVAPTLLELAGLPAMRDADGASLAGHWKGGGESARVSYVESDVRMFEANLRRPVPGTAGKLRALRDGRFKLILTPRPGGPAFELYDVARDPREEHDLSGDPAHASRLEAMRRQLSQLVPETERAFLEDALADSPGAPPSGRDLELLRRLGYVE
jgi:arylsulfatase A-like enzyme